MDGSKCPEDGNSTDCLLRNVLQFLNESRAADAAEPGYDQWNIYVTIISGLVATYIALGSSTERVFARTTSMYKKTNRGIIGKWSRLNRLGWSLATMNFQLTANTPVLGAAFLQEWMEQRGPVSQGHAAASSQRRKGSRPGAAWCWFPEEVGLDGIDPERMSTGDALRPVLVDRLPGDLAAPPAYAQIGFAAAAVASKGLQAWSFNSKSGESTFIGPRFRLDLRQHATLGLVGVYVRHQPRDLEVLPLLEGIRNNMDHGRGIIGVRSGTTRASCGEKSAQTEVIHLLDGMNRNQIPDSLSGSSAIFSRYPDCFWPQESSLPRDVLLIFTLFFCAIPETAPGLFPVSVLKTKHPLTILALNGNYWANARLGDFSGSVFSPEVHVCEVPQWLGFSWDADTRTLMEIKTCGSGNNFRETRRRIHDEFLGERTEAADSAANGHSATPGERQNATAAPGKRDEDDRDFVRDQKVCRGSLTVLHLCLRLLHGHDELEDWFSKASHWTREYLRSLCLKQLGRVDEWIKKTSHGGQDEGRRRAATLAADSMILYKATEALEYDKSKAKNTKTTAKNDDAGQQDVEEARVVRDSPRDRHRDLLLALPDLLATFNRNKATAEVPTATEKPDEQDFKDQNKPTGFTGVADDRFDLQSFARKSAKHRRWLSHLSGASLCGLGAIASPSCPPQSCCF